jgi:hypothetical protein
LLVLRRISLEIASMGGCWERRRKDKTSRDWTPRALSYPYRIVGYASLTFTVVFCVFKLPLLLYVWARAFIALWVLVDAGLRRYSYNLCFFQRFFLLLRALMMCAALFYSHPEWTLA